MVARAAPVVAALALAAGAPAAHALVTLGYPYARECPRRGERNDVDRWRMNTCNCTSYVAWALDANDFRTDWFIHGAMDALNWPNVARRRHIAVGRFPRVGAVAVWPRVAPPFGHVAFVTRVHRDGTFDVAEYNLPGRPVFSFDTRAGLSAHGVTFLYVPLELG